MKKIHYIVLIYSIIATLLLYITENVFHPSYIIIVLQKVLSFIIIPLFVWYYLKERPWKFGKITKESFVYGITFWVLSAVIIYVSYFILKDQIDWQSINSSLETRWITAVTFIFVFVYIMFWNSLIEEYFFRWFIFNSLLKFNKFLAFIFSSFLFSFYHMAIFWTWFSWYLIVLALIGLFIGSLFFSWLFIKTKWIWWAYIFHIIVDLIIVVIWYIQLFK